MSASDADPKLSPADLLHMQIIEAAEELYDCSYRIAMSGSEGRRQIRAMWAKLGRMLDRAESDDPRPLEDDIRGQLRVINGSIGRRQ
jgi:hypothetical protein